MGAETWTTILAWLLTYTLQSTLLLGGAWLAIKLLPRLNDVVREAIWKSALLTGILTATIYCATGFSPLGHALVVEASPAMASANAGVDEATESAPALEFSSLTQEELHELALLHLMADVQRGGADAAADPAGEAAPAEATHARGGWMDPFSNPRGWVIGWISACLLFAGGASLLAGLARARLNRRLRHRGEIDDPALRRMLIRLCHRAGVRGRIRLTRCDGLRIPMAFGIVRPEICLPSRAIDTLRHDELESLLAHELAHLVYRDPAWLLVCHLLENALFFQPLNRVAGRRIREFSEFRCDAWAAEMTGRAGPLARCLMEVAGWLVQRPAQPALDHVAGMAHDRSVLHRRIERLVDWRRPRRRVRARRSMAALVVLLTAGSALALPAVNTSRPFDEAPDRTDPVPPIASVADETTHESTKSVAGARHPADPPNSATRHELMLELHHLDLQLSAVITELEAIEQAIAPHASHGVMREIHTLVRGLKAQAQNLQTRRGLIERELTPPLSPPPPRDAQPIESRPHSTDANRRTVPDRHTEHPHQPESTLTGQEGTLR